MIRLIASDLDGTLMHDDRSVPDEFYRLYAALKSRGVTFVAASGNQSSTLCHVLEPIQDELTYISDNGGLIVEDAAGSRTTLQSGEISLRLRS